jgi:hypothetical protein
MVINHETLASLVAANVDVSQTLYFPVPFDATHTNTDFNYLAPYFQAKDVLQRPQQKGAHRAEKPEDVLGG